MISNEKCTSSYSIDSYTKSIGKLHQKKCIWQTILSFLNDWVWKLSNQSYVTVPIWVSINNFCSCHKLYYSLMHIHFSIFCIYLHFSQCLNLPVHCKFFNTLPFCASIWLICECLILAMQVTKLLFSVFNTYKREFSLQICLPQFF